MKFKGPNSFCDSKNKCGTKVGIYQTFSIAPRRMIPSQPPLAKFPLRVLKSLSSKSPKEYPSQPRLQSPNHGLLQRPRLTHWTSGRCKQPLHGAAPSSSDSVGCVCSSVSQDRPHTSHPQAGSAGW